MSLCAAAPQQIFRTTRVKHFRGNIKIIAFVFLPSVMLHMLLRLWNFYYKIDVYEMDF